MFNSGQFKIICELQIFTSYGVSWLTFKNQMETNTFFANIT